MPTGVGIGVVVPDGVVLGSHTPDDEMSAGSWSHFVNGDAISKSPRVFEVVGLTPSKTKLARSLSTPTR
ncbi:hypothetical protein C475_14473 [Halosimplex carlsbadense 2-9-1]|uniref:Uncharacterized protein n=1 Tax=Halosimplex carlsbadense 2-9-1 TaxID=797114 RepID=M0CJS2_9EURY|nr:hypothetical protein C475_14473 [Halosimplex carlsbadense 2-9-1]